MTLRGRSSRRQFSVGAFLSLVAGCSRKVTAPTTKPQLSSNASAPSRVLILGGTGFLGPALVNACQDIGAEVTLFNRGKTNPHLFPELEKLRGDRNEDLSALKGHEFDWVLDTSGYFPRQVEASAGLLRDHAERYLFVSSISAYANLGVAGIDERQGSAPMPVPYSEELPTHYGALKAGCERAAESAMPGRSMVVRPGLIVGPGDPTDRFTYWPTRVARGGDVLAPNAASDPVQYIDVRDLAQFSVGALAAGQSGVFNAAGPTEPTTVGEFLGACKAVTKSDAEFRYAPTALLREKEVAPWMELTVWVPTDDEQFGGMLQVDNSKALAAGLTTRPVEETIADTLAWWNSLPQARRDEPKAGLAADKERDVLAALADAANKAA